jgi:hypothetical protein
VLTKAVRAGVRLSSFGPAASDLEELFLQITDADAATAGGASQHSATEVRA